MQLPLEKRDPRYAGIPRMDRMKTISPAMFSKHISGPFLNTYYILKAQSTVLSSFADKVRASGAAIPRPLNGRIKQFLVTLEELQKCSIVELYDRANDQIASLREILNEPSATPEFASLMEICFKALLTMTRRLYAVSYSKTIDFVPDSPTKTSGVQRDSQFVCEEDVVICRICDERVRIEDLEAHTKSCIAAYRNASTIERIDEELHGFIEQIRAQLAQVGWPGDMRASVDKNLPLLNAYLLTTRILSLDPENPDTSFEFAAVMDSLSSIVRVMEDIKWSKMIGDLREKVNERRHATMAMRDAADVLKWTRISGDDRTMKLASISIADFTFIKLISAGAFARVFLAQKNKTGDIYAIKVQPKNEMIQKNQVERVMLEKDLLLQFNNPYIINFFYSIVGKHNLYLVMEYLPGGDLYSLLSKFGGLDEENTKVYMFQIATALSYLHAKGIIHRDLKPDNVLVSSTGTLKLTDFGLSYQGFLGRQNSHDDDIVESKSMVGTPDYISPEIVMRRPHTFTVDWWALGIMIYEFIMGDPPFHSDTEMEIYSKIVKGRYVRPTLDDGASPACIDIITRLLDPNPATRLGAHGSEEVLNHPWFAGLKESELVAPFVPELKDKHDTEYFESRYQFRDDEEGDIREDIALAESRCMAMSTRVRSKSSSIINGMGGMEKVRSPSCDTEDQMSKFSAVSVAQLEGVNRAALRMCGGKRTSNGLSAKVFKPQTQKRRRNFSSFSSQDDSILSDMPALHV